MKIPKEELEKAKSYLIDDYKISPGSKIYCILDHISSSGMTRRIKLLVVSDGNLHNISHLASKVTGYPLKDNAVVIKGCGMDMGFALVCDLSYRLFSDENALSHVWK